MNHQLGDSYHGYENNYIDFPWGVFPWAFFWTADDIATAIGLANKTQLVIFHDANGCETAYNILIDAYRMEGKIQNGTTLGNKLIDFIEQAYKILNLMRWPIISRYGISTTNHGSLVTTGIGDTWTQAKAKILAGGFSSNTLSDQPNHWNGYIGGYSGQYRLSDGAWSAGITRSDEVLAFGNINAVDYDLTGKLIVASTEDALPAFFESIGNVTLHDKVNIAKTFASYSLLSNQTTKEITYTDINYITNAQISALSQSVGGYGNRLDGSSRLFYIFECDGVDGFRFKDW